VPIRARSAQAASATLASHGIVASHAVYVLEWLVVAATSITLVVAISVALARGAVEAPKKRKNDRRVAGATGNAASFVVTATGVIGAVGHVVFVNVSKDEAWAPNFDLVAIAWVGVALVGLLLPRISEFAFAGLSLRVLEVAQAEEEADDVIGSATELAANWNVAVNEVLAALEDRAQAHDETFALITNFMQLRAFEALEWLGLDDERRRLSVWLFDAPNDELFFFFSNEIGDAETVNFTFPVGIGILGCAFREHRVWNERDAAALPVYVSIRRTPPRYHGILCVPIDFGLTRLGVLCVDREKDDYFEDRDVNVMRALASSLGTVLGNERAQAVLDGDDLSGTESDRSGL
jgi:GAF domain-containing protein